MKDGGYKRLMGRFSALRQRVALRYVRTLWVLSREAASNSYSLLDTYEQAKIAGYTGHELRLRIDDKGMLSCDLVKQPL